MNPEILEVLEVKLDASSSHIHQTLSSLGLMKIIQAIAHDDPRVRLPLLDFFKALPSSKYTILRRQKLFQDAIAHSMVFANIYDFLQGHESNDQKLLMLENELGRIIKDCGSPLLVNLFHDLKGEKTMSMLHERQAIYRANHETVELSMVKKNHLLSRLVSCFAIFKGLNLFVDLIGKNKAYLTFPTIVNKDWHYDGLFNLETLINEKSLFPQSLAIQNGNHLTISGHPKTGKTTLIKSIGQAYWLAQIGFPVPAKDFKFIPVEMINYRSLQISLHDENHKSMSLNLFDDHPKHMMPYLSKIKERSNCLMVTTDTFPLQYHGDHFQRCTRYLTSIRQNYYRFVGIEPDQL